MQNRKNTLHYLTQEIRDSFNRMFLLAIAGIVGCVLLDNVFAVPLIWKMTIGEINVLYYLRESLCVGFYGLFVIPLMTALPYSLGYYRDIQAGITRNVISKTGMTVYCVGKMVSVFFSGFLSCVCGLGIFSILVSCFRPLGIKEQAMEYEGMPFSGYYISEQYTTYLLIRLLLFGVWCGLWCLVALCVSAYVQKASIILASITVLLFAWNTLNNLLGIHAVYRPASWFSGYYGLGSDTATAMGCVLFTLATVSVLWFIFHRKVKQNLYMG